MTQGHEVVANMNVKKGEIFIDRPDANEAPKQFTFDKVYDWNAKQCDIYEHCAADIIANVLEGYNGTIFAYGQTGTGKTHTMSGNERCEIEKGIMPRSFGDIFK
jgi:kinesin family protein 3/17